MASIESLRVGVRTALDTVTSVCTRLTKTLDTIQAAGETYARLDDGSARSDLPNAAAYLEHAYDMIRQAIVTLNQASAAATDYLTELSQNLLRRCPAVVAALEIWFDADQETGRLITNGAELDTVLDEISARSSPSFAVLAQCVFVEEGQPAPWSPTLDIGFHAGVGTIYFSDDPGHGYVTQGHGPEDGEPVVYMYMGSDTEFPPNAEIPADLVRHAAHEAFTTAGRRPTGVEWQEWPRDTGN